MIDTHVLNRGGAACIAQRIDSDWHLRGMNSRRNRLTKRAVIALSRPPDSLFLTARRKSRIWPRKKIVSRDRLTSLLKWLAR